MNIRFPDNHVLTLTNFMGKDKLKLNILIRNVNFRLEIACTNEHSTLCMRITLRI